MNGDYDPTEEEEEEELWIDTSTVNGYVVRADPRNGLCPRMILFLSVDSNLGNNWYFGASAWLLLRSRESLWFFRFVALFPV